MDGLIYYYTSGYVGQTINLKGRHKSHLRKHPSWNEPVILEVIKGKDQKDLTFNLSWAELIWMFKLHTYNKVWKQGLNKVLPFTNDYRNIKTFETCSKGGKCGGGKHAMSASSKERQLRGCSLAGQKGGGKHEMSFASKKRQIEGIRKANKSRWHFKCHVPKRLINKDCELCQM